MFHQIVLSPLWIIEKLLQILYNRLAKLLLKALNEPINSFFFRVTEEKYLRKGTPLRCYNEEWAKLKKKKMEKKKIGKDCENRRESPRMQQAIELLPFIASN